jgi:hypothetical protein
MICVIGEICGSVLSLAARFRARKPLNRVNGENGATAGTMEDRNVATTANV